MPEYLDAEIANEGMPAEWMPAVEKPRIPTYEGIKSIAKYFPQFTGRPYQHKTFPCWLYHPKQEPKLVQDILTGDDPPRLVKRASEIAKEMGCIFRESTMEEKAMGWPHHRWVYSDEWRATPFHVGFNPNKPDTGKHVVDPKKAESPNYETIAAAVAIAMERVKSQGGPAAAEADPAWIEFQAFKAWKEAGSGAATEIMGDILLRNPGLDIAPNALHVIAEDEEREFLLEQAKEKGIKVDGRWSLHRLKSEVEKA